MKLPKWATKVTPLSKMLAMLLFAIIPVIGFLVGVQYQKIIDITQCDIVTYANSISK